MTIVFEVTLNNAIGVKQPWNTLGDNIPFTKSTWLPNQLLNNYDLKHGDRFTATGLEAVYLRDNYTTGVNPPLKIISQTL